MAELANPPEAVVSFQGDIVPLFRPMDIQCMRSMGVFLVDYGFMSDPDNLQNVIDHLRGTGGLPRMPEGGPYWPDESIQLLEKWRDGGFKP